jgi:hypothetical protein
MILNQIAGGATVGVNGLAAVPGLLARANEFDPLPFIGYEIHQCKNMLAVTYDFAVLGGATTAAINLLDDQGNGAYLPVGSYITLNWFNIITQPTSAGSATVAFGVTAANDLLAATAKASLTVGVLAGAVTAAAATYVQLATGNTQVKVGNFVYSGKPVTVTVATAALTAGKIYMYIDFVRSATT